MTENEVPGPENPLTAPAIVSPVEDDGAKGKVKIENGILFVEVPLTQKYAKILAKGLLMDALDVVDQYFVLLQMKKAQREAESLASSKRVIDRFINKNGDQRGL